MVLQQVSVKPSRIRQFLCSLNCYRLWKKMKSLPVYFVKPAQPSYQNLTYKLGLGLAVNKGDTQSGFSKSHVKVHRQGVHRQGASLSTYTHDVISDLGYLQLTVPPFLEVWPLSSWSRIVAANSGNHICILGSRMRGKQRPGTSSLLRKVFRS